jgi:hypothetical protein
MIINRDFLNKNFFITLLFLFLGGFYAITAQVLFEKEIKISDTALYFNGNRVNQNATNTGDNAPYDFLFGRVITPHGDCIKTYNEYVFMTWYRGGKADRHVMLTRYNTITGISKTIEFPHRHTGFQNQPWIGESHNTIAVAVSPIDGTIHLLYDMHAYSRTRPSDGSLSNDYFRYSYSQKNAASVSDDDFTLNQFIKDSGDGDYKHLSLNGGESYSEFQGLTYPQFFLNDSGDLFMYMREGGNNNGAYKFSKYATSTSTWSEFTHFNTLNARLKGETYNWGLYGNMKYVNGKIRIGFQRRSSNNSDKFQYQNGVYYAYSDNQTGKDSWKNYKGEAFSLPLIDADKAKVMEPGDLVTTTAANEVYIVGGFDWTVTDSGDIHMISEVKDTENNITKYAHTYKKEGETDFITTTNFAGAESIYTFKNDVYIIGLSNSGRVYVEKAAGGTNDFTRVYQATSGRSFKHGKVHIADGKLYYYLMENRSGSAQPIYLQVIDLGIAKEPFNVSLNAPFDNEIFNTGETIQLAASASTDTGTISKVEFWIDNQFYSEDATNSYHGEWSTEIPGTHTIKAIAYNNLNESISSAEISVEIKELNNSDLTGNLYRIKNVGTGRYLDSEETSLIASESGSGNDKEWEFVKAGEFYNIDSNSDRGILRATGTGQIINTGFGAPREDIDKQWIVNYEDDGTYRFETRNTTKYLYNEVDNTISASENIDDRSKWQVELASSPLSVADEIFNLQTINVYPNPARNNFTIELKGSNTLQVIITDVLGKTVYKKTTTNNRLEIIRDDKFTPGVYLIRAIGDNQKVFNQKIILE